METELTFLGMGPAEWFACGFGAGMVFAFAMARKALGLVDGLRAKRGAANDCTGGKDEIDK